MIELLLPLGDAAYLAEISMASSLPLVSSKEGDDENPLVAHKYWHRFLPSFLPSCFAPISRRGFICTVTLVGRMAVSGAAAEYVE